MTEKQRYFIELSFDGTNYHGWQIQKNALSVQEVLNKCLSTVLREPIETTGCGRTDTGVHAKEFFAHFDLADSSWFIVHSQKDDAKGIGKAKTAHVNAASMNHEPSTMNILRSLNSVLPRDIAVKSIFPVAADAHARFGATLRTYEYHIHFNKDPFKNGRSWELRDEPDLN